MNVNLRPSTLGEILDRTVNLYRSRFLVFFGIASAPAAVVLGCAGGCLLMVAWTGKLGPEQTLVAGLAVLGLATVGLPLYIAASGLSGAALCHAANELHLGEAITILGAYKAAWKRGWRYMGIYFMQALVVGVAPMAAWALFVGMLAAMAAFGGGVRTGDVEGARLGLMMLIMLGLAVYAVWMLLRVCLAFPAAVAEQAGVWASLKRAAAISRGTRWRILLLFLLGMVIGWLAALLVTVPVTIAVMLIPGMNTPQHTEMMGTVLLITWYASWFAVQALTRPLYGIALVLFYYDQRVRLEGFDIEMLMREAGMVAVGAAQHEGAPWMPPVTHAAQPAPESGTQNEVRESAEAERAAEDTPGQTAGGPA